MEKVKQAYLEYSKLPVVNVDPLAQDGMTIHEMLSEVRYQLDMNALGDNPMTANQRRQLNRFGAKWSMVSTLNPQEVA